MATVGKTSIGASSTVYSSSEYILTEFTPTSDGFITSVSMYTRTTYTTGSKTCRVSIYSKSGTQPLVLQADAGGTFDENLGWVTVSISCPIQSGVPIYIGFWAEVDYDGYYDAGSSNQTYIKSGGVTYPTWEDPFTLANYSTAAEEYSIYATYTESNFVGYATLGNTRDKFLFNEGSSSKFTPDEDGTIDSIWVATNVGGDFAAAVYSDNAGSPDQLLVYSGVITIPAGGWYEFSSLTEVSAGDADITNGTPIHIALWPSNEGSTRGRSDTGATNQYTELNQGGTSYGTWDTAVGVNAQSNLVLSSFLEYTPSALYTKVNGVAWASITKVNGVAKASITKIVGI